MCKLIDQAKHYLCIKDCQSHQTLAQKLSSATKILYMYQIKV